MPLPGFESPTTVKTADIWADSKGHARCRSCHAPIVWAEFRKSGKRMPFDAPLVVISAHSAETPTGTRMVEVVDLAQSHFASCPNADQHRRKR